MIRNVKNGYFSPSHLQILLREEERLLSGPANGIALPGGGGGVGG
jgi:hypothetical protein